MSTANFIPSKIAPRRLTGPHPVHDANTLNEIFLLRAQVWTATGNAVPDAFGPDGWRDACDEAALHWAIFDEWGTVAAAARMTMHPCLGDLDEAAAYEAYHLNLMGPIAAPARVVVRPDAQGNGLAQRLLAAQDHAARLAKARWAARQASPQMVPLLARAGWRILGPGLHDRRFPSLTFQVALLDLMN